jgi:hypothetical protein
MYLITAQDTKTLANCLFNRGLCLVASGQPGVSQGYAL